MGSCPSVVASVTSRLTADLGRLDLLGLDVELPDFWSILGPPWKSNEALEELGFRWLKLITFCPWEKMAVCYFLRFPLVLALLICLAVSPALTAIILSLCMPFWDFYTEFCAFVLIKVTGGALLKMLYFLFLTGCTGSSWITSDSLAVFSFCSILDRNGSLGV